ncbi:cyclic nucleotide-binding domain-containing protein [Microbispora hainanensis]|uniref:Cyclic nucleotide-binding domain-containing protein n=1 Tax=Microbispora hainanensis TaxID=568844 RepID=A0ABZ1SVW4_9ACTN|nr:cyclic nucleotide-binding domain-containing protein [Microbispora hainanensis]
MRVESKITSISWIPSEAVKGYTKPAFTMGFTHYDDPPPDVITDVAGLRDRDAFRFANRLRVWAEFDGDRVVAHGADGGLVMGATTVRLGPLGVRFAAYGLPDLRPEPRTGDGWITFRQTAGGRTALPFPRRVSRPPYLRMQSPLVWTTLAVTLHADGRTEGTLEGASPFPRHWVYGPDDRLTLKAGLTDITAWAAQAGPDRTPWGDEDSPVLVTAAETALERRLSLLIMRGARKPVIRSLPAGTRLVRQGEPGSSLFLLLDGVLGVDVDGTPLPELGPGAILGERAVLEGGLRTATLTALTPVRVAEAAADAVDRKALAALAEGHRREEQLT